jgi:hypothetical protein
MGMTPAIDVLLDARALLARPNGWVQGQRQVLQPDGVRAYCIEGALDEADPGLGLASPAWARVQSVLVRPIPEYNDEPGRQQSEVVQTIDRAIESEWRGDPLSTPRELLQPAIYPSEMLKVILDGGPDPTPQN